MITTSVKSIPPTIASRDASVVAEQVDDHVLATRPESANTSPCAKLISCRIP